MGILTLKKLEKIDISNTKVTVLPPEIGELEFLKELAIQNTPLLESKPFSILKSKSPSEVAAFFKRITLKDEIPKFHFEPHNPQERVFSILSWNILASKVARRDFYPLSTEKCMATYYRDTLTAQIVDEIHPDIIALQEFEARQASDWSKPFIENGYWVTVAPKGRYYTKKPADQLFVHGQATFVNLHRFDVLISQLFYPRDSKLVSADDTDIKGCDDVVLITAVRTHSKPSKNYIILNVHMKFNDAEVRKRLAEIIMKETLNFAHQQFKVFGIIVVGDFNDKTNSPTLQRFYDFKLSNIYDAFHSTVNTAIFQKDDAARIDHILISKNIKVKSILSQDTYGQLAEAHPFIPCYGFPSDHLPIGAVIEI
ncbi:poly(A)-specific ribonuclease protein [Trichomonas vaginalis G3]|nr:poly(A)-specific ribonuclease protein [Trichomonas vaginalis G3]KAI5531232.1 poly(A)-specific ribonuclease protein [Trichomonas vaginalis G3]